MKTNPQMDVLLDEVRQVNLDAPAVLPQRLLALLDGGFVEANECVFLANLKNAAPVNRLDFPDLTAYECFVNHVHIEDYLENGGLPPLELLGCGMAAARELKDRLSRLHGSKHFRIIVTPKGAECAVRFHTIRPDQEWVDKELDLLHPEAIAIFETHEAEP